MKKLHKFLLGTAFAISTVVSVSYADGHGNDHVASTVAYDGQFEQFKPGVKTSNARMDYEMMDAALENTVFRMGLSARRHMSRPEAKLGSRIVTGHTSPYRLEGSRVMFSFLSDSYIDQLQEYRQDLETIANQVDISKLDKKEQLAFWFNLHNVAVIEQIAKKYPTTYPHKIKVDGVLLDEAKFITIRGVSMSPSDIRTKIVYPNWQNPLVIYGFFHGNIGSPALQNYAYTRDNLSTVLSFQAREFVNSLRGFNYGGSTRRVSKHYDEARPFYFKNWDKDVTAHLLKYARDEVAEDIRKPVPLSLDRYDYVIADMMAGDRPRIASAATWVGGPSPSIPAEMTRLLSEVEEKRNTLRERGQIRTGRVIITDSEIEDVD